MINIDKKGQHQLINKIYIKKITDYASINKNDVILEIGAGKGTLTEELIKKAKFVYTIEIDKKYKKFLDKLPKENLKIIYNNILKLELPKFNKIISNLPFNILEPLLLRLTQYKFSGIITISKHSADLLTKGESRLSLIIPAYFEIKILEDIPKESFSPKPKVNATIISIKTKEIKQLKDEPKNYLIRLIFDRRYSKCKNALREALIDYYKDIKNSKLTKKEARIIIKNLKKELLEKKIGNLSSNEIRIILNSINITTI